jgi:hypothetical protein
VDLAQLRKKPIASLGQDRAPLLIRHIRVVLRRPLRRFAAQSLGLGDASVPQVGDVFAETRGCYPTELFGILRNSLNRTSMLGSG